MSSSVIPGVSEALLTAQTGVLGSLVIDARCAPEVFLRTDEGQFSGPYLALYRAALDLHRKGAAIDSVTLAHEMREHGYSAEDAGRFLVQLMELTPTASHVGAYLDLLEEQTALRRAVEIAGDLTSAVSLSELRDASERLSAVLTKQTGTEVVEAPRGYIDLCLSLSTPVEAIPWGIPKLSDVVLSQPGDFVLLGGRPSAGKTALSLHMAWEQAQRHRVGYFSLETSPQEIYARLVSMVSGVDGNRIRRRMLSDEEKQRVVDAGDAFDARQLDVVNAAAMTVDDIRAQTLCGRYEIIYVDYLQIISAPQGKRQDRYYAVTELSMALHRMAVQLGVLVVGLSHLSRPDKKAAPRAPGLADLRESGQLEQDAEAVFLLHRADEEDNRSNRILRIAKNKKGPAGGYIELAFDGQTQRFSAADQTGQVASALGSAGRRVKREAQQQAMQGFRPVSIDDSDIPF